MKVLFISSGEYKYGAPKSMMTLIKGLKDELNVEPILLTKRHSDLNDYCDRQGIENYSVWYRDIMAGSPYSHKLLTLMKHIVKYLLFLLGGITQRRVMKLPIDFSTIDIVHSNTNRQDIGAFIARKHNIKHVWHVRETQKAFNIIFYKKKCIQYMNQNTDAYIMISKIVQREWIKQGLLPNLSCVIYDGMDTENIVKKNRKISDGNIKVVIIGRIEPNKGQLQIVQAIAHLPNEIKRKMRLDIIGDAYFDYRKVIEQVIEENGIQNQVRFLGFQSNLNERLSEYDIGVTCSKEEGFGRCTIEYMLAGLLTIASDTGANPELIEDGKNGILYKYNDTIHFSEKLKWVIEHDEESRNIAEKGYEDASSKYSRKKCADKVYELYQKLL